MEHHARGLVRFRRRLQYWTMTKNRIPAAFIRGGTSKGVFFHERDLPNDREKWNPLFLDVIGAPDPNRRQLNGMGGGLSSLNKVIVVRLSQRNDADVDYTFAQIASDKPIVDYTTNCGNLSSAIGPFAIDEGLMPVEDGERLVRLFNTNTDKFINAYVPVHDGKTVEAGDYQLPGVAGTGAQLRLDYLDPGGAGTGSLLPTGNAMDTLNVEEFGNIKVSLVDVSTPMVFVAAKDIALTATEVPTDLDSNERAKTQLERLRRAGAVRMGMAKTLSDTVMASPRIAICNFPTSFTSLSGDAISAASQDITIRVISSGDTHRASPLTTAMCLGAACKIKGTIPHKLANNENMETRIGNPSGVLTVGAEVVNKNGKWRVIKTYSFRTQRRLMEGFVMIPD